jgi:phosphatidylglycerol lysyltransferase
MADSGAVRRLVIENGHAVTAWQILNPGIEHWLAPAGDAVVGYVVSGGYRVVAAAPICPAERLVAVVAEFEEDARRRGLRTCYFAANERLAQALAERGPYDRILLGAQPMWHPAAWPQILAGKASLRAQLSRARNKEVRVAAWPPQQAQGHPELQRCLDEWLKTRGLPSLHFLVEPDTLDTLEDRRIYVAERKGQAVGFLVASPIPKRKGWLIEQIIRGKKAPNGTAELMLDAAFCDLAAGGAELVSLGLSPLSKRAGIVQENQPFWIKLMLGWMRAHGRRFYNFDGLDAFKAKFLPQSWEPVWAITSERRISPRTLWAITGAFADGSPVVMVARALARAAQRELAWLRQRGRRQVV